MWRLATQQFSGDINGQSVTDGETNTNGKEDQTMNADNIDDAFPSKYLKASDLPEEGTLPATIEDVAMEEIGKNREKKPIIRFEELDKALVCNKTNCNTIAKITGSRRFKDWVGKMIHLYRVEVEFQGEMIESIRVRLKPDQGPTNITRCRSRYLQGRSGSQHRAGLPIFSMNQTPIQNTLQRLKEVKETEAGWKALCPAHKDGNPSLSIKEAPDGKVILNCFAGCEFNAICAAIGLEPRRLVSKA